MPEIAAAAMPAAAVAPVMPTGSAAPVTVAGGVQDSPTQAGVAALAGAPTLTFLDQLKTALAGLSRGRAPTPAAMSDAGQTPSAASAAPTSDAPQPANAHAAPSSAAGTPLPTDTAMAEVLAALGLIPVPPTLTPTATAATGDATAESEPVAASAGQLLNAPSPLAAQAPIGPSPVVPGDVDPTAAESTQAPATLTQPADTPAAVQPSSLPAASISDVRGVTAHARATPAAPTEQPASLSASNAPSAPSPAGFAAGTGTVTGSDTTANVAVGRADTPPVHPTGHPSSTDTSRTTPLTAAAATPVEPMLGHSGAQHGRGSAEDASDAGAGQTFDGQPQAPTGDPSTVNQAAPVPGATQETPGLAANAHPSEVVAQIAHQAELYRLPGNKGLRIQLHPDDLGGVAVTVKYGVGGGLELHVTAERAETGSLVQAGWTELRDALATHGISPERLVVSVSAPPSASGSDLSGGNSGSRPGSNQGAFNFAQGQSQSGHQRDSGEARSAFAWTRSFESSSSAAVEPAARVGTGSSSRIDYRA